MLIDNNKVITLAYQIAALPQEENGKEVLLEERTAEEPLEFIFGTGALLNFVEESLRGQSSGFIKSLTVYPEDGYGYYNEKLLTWMDKSKFPKGMDLKLGMKFQTQGPNGDPIAVILKEIKDNKVLIDGNHPLAGMVLRFDLRVLRVREASAKELATGKADSTFLH